MIFGQMVCVFLFLDKHTISNRELTRHVLIVLGRRKSRVPPTLGGGSCHWTQQKTVTSLHGLLLWETDFLPLLVLARRGAAPVRISTGNNFPRKYPRNPLNYYQYWC